MVVFGVKDDLIGLVVNLIVYLCQQINEKNGEILCKKPANAFVANLFVGSGKNRHYSDN